MTESDKDNEQFFKNLYNSYISLRDSIDDHIEQQLEKVNSKNKTLKEQLEQYKAEAENLRKVSIVSNLNRQIKELTRDNDRLSKTNGKRHKTITNLNIQLEKLREDLENSVVSEDESNKSENKSDVDSNVSEAASASGAESEAASASEAQAEQSASASDSNQEEDDMDEVEISGKTYSINANDELLQRNTNESTYAVVGKLIDDVPYFHLDCYYNMTSGGIYDKYNVSLKIGKLSKKYLAKLNS